MNLLLEPPLAELYKLDGIQPRNQSDPLWVAAAKKLERDEFVHQNWASVAMAMLKSMVGGVGCDTPSAGVKVQAKLRPGDRVVLYCSNHGDKEVRLVHNMGRGWG